MVKGRKDKKLKLKNLLVIQIPFHPLTVMYLSFLLINIFLFLDSRQPSEKKEGELSGCHWVLLFPNQQFFFKRGNDLEKDKGISRKQFFTHLR